MQYDYLIVGAGLYGAVFARELTRLGKRPLWGQGMAKQCQSLGLGHMDMAAGGLQFNKDPPQHSFGDGFQFQKITPWLFFALYRGIATSLRSSQ